MQQTEEKGMNKFIWEKQNALSSEFCKNVIYKFERDLRKYSGVTLGGENSLEKKSTDLSISGLSYWEEEDKIFHLSLIESLEEYINYLSKRAYFRHSELFLNYFDTGYQIQRTIGGVEYYNWHNDFHATDNIVRRITFIWYLNSIDGPGGETEFYDGTKIKPEEGKLLFFPATWNFTHRGKVPPKETVKYLCTGWLWVKI